MTTATRSALAAWDARFWAPAAGLCLACMPPAYAALVRALGLRRRRDCARCGAPPCPYGLPGCRHCPR